MKKLIVIFIFCFITGIATVHAAYQRKQKKPNFFMPSNALQNSTEKNIQKQKNLWQKTKPAKLAPQLTKSTNNVKPEISEQTPDEDNSTKIKTNKAPMPEKQTTAPQQPLETNELNHSKNATLSQNTTKAQPQAKKISNTDNPLPQNIDDAFAQSFSEYQKDLQDIANGQQINNHRLLKMINKFQDKEISFTIKD